MNLKVSDAKREDGFTLIELLVVVIIIGILAAIAIPVFLNQRAQAWERTAQSDARNTAIALESYFNDEFAYPAGDTVADGNSVSIGGETITASQASTVEWVIGDSATGTDDAFWVCVQHANISTTEYVAIYKSDEGGIDPDINRNALEAACGGPVA